MTRRLQSAAMVAHQAYRRVMEAGVPTTLHEAVLYFADKQVAHDFFVSIRFPNGVACPRYGCGSANVVAIKGRKEWRCRECGRQSSVKVGTIFESSPIGGRRLTYTALISANPAHAMEMAKRVRKPRNAGQSNSPIDPGGQV